jgi:DNA repair exonuclease SbcCD ATPase subunit
MNTEFEIQTEVEALRARFSETKDLYREVCALLFFRYGITPTANKLYQFVRKGSMSAPADALAKFWTDLRSKARVEIDHPDLPESIKAAAAQAIAAIWHQASEAARQELGSARTEAAAEVVEVRAELDGLRQQLEDELLATAEARASLADAERRLEERTTELFAERRTHAATAARSQDLDRQLAEARIQAERAMAEFRAELDAARKAVDTANLRADAAERRCNLEIDQERQARLKADKATDAMRSQLAASDARLRATELASAEQVARLQTALDAAQRGQAELHATVDRFQQELPSLQSALTASQQVADRHQTEAQTLRALLDRWSHSAPKPGSPKKNKNT